jgi:hypothetical protein
MKTNKILKNMQQNPQNVSFSDLVKICDFYFGKPRNTGGSHFVYKTPWSGDPRINIQKSKNKAKAYQVKQVLLAIEKLGDSNG